MYATMDYMGKLLSTSEAAEMLGLTRQRVNQLIHAGLLKAQRVGRSYIIDEDDLREFEQMDRPVGVNIRWKKDIDKKQ